MSEPLTQNQIENWQRLIGLRLPAEDIERIRDVLQVRVNEEGTRIGKYTYDSAWEELKSGALPTITLRTFGGVITPIDRKGDHFGHVVWWPTGHLTISITADGVDTFIGARSGFSETPSRDECVAIFVDAYNKHLRQQIRGSHE